MSVVRALIAGVVASACVIVVGCGDDSTGTTGNSQSDLPPGSCPATPCMVGAICMGPVESACDGTWYCWSDQKWHCAPPDGGGGGGFPPDATTSDVTPGG